MLGQNRGDRNRSLLICQGVLNFTGALLAIFLWRHFEDVRFNTIRIVLLLSGLAVACCALRGTRPSDLKTSLLFFANLLPVFAILWASNTALVTEGRYWFPFEAHELSSLTIAILAPPTVWVGIFSIAAVPVLAGAQFLSFPPEVVQTIHARPLMGPIAFAAFAIVLYLFRLRGIRLAEAAAKSEADAQATSRLTRAMFAVKDLANTPIQALLLDAETLRRKSPDDHRLAQRIEQSATKLKDLNQILDEHLLSNAGDEGDVSLDSIRELVGGRRRH